MREVKCKTFGLTKSVLGKATRTRVKKKYRSTYIWVGERRLDSKLGGYAAAIVDEFPQESYRKRLKGVPLAILINSLNEIEDEDVLLVDPKKQCITTLYKKGSSHNAIFVTSRCDSACIMCPQPPTPDAGDRDNINRRLIQLMAPGPDNLALTGGEPAVMGNQLISLIEYCRRKLPETRLILLTNARKLKDVRYVDSLATVGYPKLSAAVPLYADTVPEHDRIMGVKGAFAETIQGLHNLALYRVPIELRIVVMSMNYMRLSRIADFIYRNLTFARHVAFMGLETCGSAEKNLDKIWIDPYDYKSELFEACKYLYRRSIPVSIYNHQLCILDKELWPIARKSISDWKNIFLPTCENCCMREHCGGFFVSALIKHSDHIFPIKSLT